MHHDCRGTAHVSRGSVLRQRCYSELLGRRSYRSGSEPKAVHMFSVRPKSNYQQDIITT